MPAAQAPVASFASGATRQYAAYLDRKVAGLAVLLACATACFVASICVGAVTIPAVEVGRALLGLGQGGRFEVIVWNIRLPQALAASLAGSGLAAAGVAMQSILRNPLGSPFTLGISQAGAFGAAFAVMILGAGVMQNSTVGAVRILSPFTTTACAFACSLAAALVIIAVSRLRGSTPEVMVLCGVALGALFTAGTMFLQFFASDVQLAAMVFWTFGDVARAGWREIGILAAVVGFAVVYFGLRRWDYNALDAGDETARGLGVAVEAVRLRGMLVASLLTAAIVAFLGVIGFVGLLCPHMVRRLMGDDHRFLLPGSCLAGAALLLAADVAARLVLAPHALPVSTLTAMLGAPAFLFLLVRGRGR